MFQLLLSLYIGSSSLKNIFISHFCGAINYLSFPLLISIGHCMRIAACERYGVVRNTCIDNMGMALTTVLIRTCFVFWKKKERKKSECSLPSFGTGRSIDSWGFLTQISEWIYCRRKSGKKFCRAGLLEQFSFIMAFCIGLWLTQPDITKPCRWKCTFH